MGPKFAIDFSGIDDIDAQALSQVLTPRPEAGASIPGEGVQFSGAGSSALVDQTLSHSPGLSMTSSSGSEHGVTIEDDEKSMICSDSGAESQKCMELSRDIEMGVM